MTGQLLDFNTARKQGEPTRHAVDAEDIRARLHADPRPFLEWMWQGRALITKREARVGDIYGTPGASLSVCLVGPDSGLWKDHATDQGGDLIALYREFRGYKGTTDFQLSLKEIARDFLRDPIEIEQPKWSTNPSPIEYIETKKKELGTKPRADLLELGAPVATYTYYDTHGNVTASVVRYEPDGTRENKTFRPYCFKTIEGVTKWVGGAPDLRPLYRLPEIALAQTVVLTEGEGKADALSKLGIAATSAMQGANAPINKTDWSPLAGKTVIVWPDNDVPGHQYAKAAAERLSALGCKTLLVDPSREALKWDAVDCVAEGKDPHTYINTATPLPPVLKPRINLLDIDDIENLPPPSWLVADTLTENGLSVLWGRSGAMKSFVALDLGLCVATGLPWHGQAVKQGLVVYVAAEGSHGLGRRAVGWRRTRGRELLKPLFKLIPHSIALASDDLDAMVLTILQLPASPVLIIIDTLARTFGQGDENKQADMNAYVSAADRLREKTGAHVMIIHHSGVHEDKRERGSNVLRGAADTVIKVARKDDKLDIINQAPEGKQKDAEEFKTIKLRTQKIHFTQADVEQSTLILNLREEVDEDPEGLDYAAEQRFGKNELLIIASIRKAGRPLGFTTLQAMTQINKGSLVRALDTLVSKDALTVDTSKNPKLWGLV
jgi:hypothetical protein